MDIYKLYYDTLIHPASICDKIRSINLSRKNIVEGAVFVACLGAIVSAVMEKFIFGSSEKINEIFSNNSVTLLFNPFATFLFELLFIFVLIFTIFSFGNISRNKRDIEEIAKLVVWICFVGLGFKVIQLIVAAGSSEASSSGFYLIFRISEMIWFIWALSSVVCVIYGFKSVVLTALTGIIVVSFIFVILLFLILSLIQSFINSGSMNV